jgi:Polysulphide reductase, NrfD
MHTHTNVSNPSGYADQAVTKAPEWYWLVVFEVLFNSLTTGLFLVAAIGELAAPATFTAVATWAYPIALALLLIDLALLVFDLGDPLRFHHMLRVFKPSSPMSVGTWCLTVYAIFLTALVAVELVVAVGWLPGDSGISWWARKVAVVGGIPFAFGSAAYKGVLFSTTAQPGWKDERWLGAYLVNSALLLGCGELLALSILGGHPSATAVLRPASVLLLLLNVLALGLLVTGVRPTRALGRLVALVLGAGVLVPLFLLAVGNSLLMVIAVTFIVLGALVVRAEIVGLPHGNRSRNDSMDRR